MSTDYAQAFNDALDAAESGDDDRARALLENVVAADGRDVEEHRSALSQAGYTVCAGWIVALCWRS